MKVNIKDMQKLNLFFKFNPIQFFPKKYYCFNFTARKDLKLIKYCHQCYHRFKTKSKKKDEEEDKFYNCSTCGNTICDSTECGIDMTVSKDKPAYIICSTCYRISSSSSSSEKSNLSERVPSIEKQDKINSQRTLRSNTAAEKNKRKSKVSSSPITKKSSRGSSNSRKKDIEKGIRENNKKKTQTQKKPNK